MFPSQKCGHAGERDHTARLQWGRDVSIPEILAATGEGEDRRCFNGAGMFPSQKYPTREWISGNYRASMGPGCFHPRNHAVRRWIEYSALASMGPGCFHPRNPAAPVLFLVDKGLQWGRDVSIPEICWLRLVRRTISPLQWGRDVSIPEICWLRLVRRTISPLQWGRDVSIPEIATALFYSVFKDLRASPRAPLHLKPKSHSRTVI